MKLHRSIARWLLLTLLIATFSAAAFGQVFISVRIGPPPLPVYAQPICPGPGFFWTPGYWAWNDDGGYYWVPGTWVVAPVGMLWTPGYWGWGGGFYAWHPGYWGPHVGFYGGINYGYGYGGVGFGGGEWRGGNFYYNRSVTNVSVTNVTNVYNKTVIVNNTTVNNVSYNGGTGGVTARPLPQEVAAEHDRHIAPVAMQTQHETLAAQNRQNFAAENHGRPAIAATAKAGDFSNRAVIPARAAGGEYHPPAMSPKEARGPSNPGYRPFTPANSNNANRTMGTSTPSPQDKVRSNEGFRPFTPPNANNSRNRNAGTGNSQNGNSQNRGAQSSPMYHDKGTSGTNPLYEKDRTVNAPKANQPRSDFHPVPPPRHENTAPPPRRENAAPPRHEGPPPQRNAPKDEHRPNKGR